MKYNRILVKVSGEALAGPKGTGIDFEVGLEIAKNIAKVAQSGVQVAVVCGAGNFWRGRSSGSFDAVRADQMGMLGTMMNAIGLEQLFTAAGVNAKVFSSVAMPNIAEVFSKRAAIEAMEQGKVVVFGGGTGCPFFTTDTAAALRAIEIEADLVLLAKNVDGVYDKDPTRNPDAKKYEKISYSEILAKRLGVIDLTAACMCMEHKMPALLFALGNGASIYEAVKGANVGTTVVAD